MSKLNQYRKEIDIIDRDIISLLARRSICVTKIAEYKKEHNMPVLQPERFQKVLAAAQTIANEQGVDAQLITILWQTMHDYYVAQESKHIADAI